MQNTDNQVLTQILTKHKTNFASVVPLNLQEANLHWFDFSKNNPELARFDLEDIAQMNDYVFGTLQKLGAAVGLGGYAEERLVYQKSKVFATQEGARSVHLGIDIWLPALTPVFTPLPARVHSFQDNDNFGDYGGTIILRHTLEGLTFYTLYGHLSKNSLLGLEEGLYFEKGAKIAEIGNETENGYWTPHLHFQIITDMLGKKGDFIGVAPKSQKDYYLEICPDPNLILNAPLPEKK